MDRRCSLVGVVLSLLGAISPAWGQATRAVPVSAARGDHSIVTVEIHRGHGVTLNFRPSGDTIRRAWLDDPSQVTLDFDDTRCGFIAAPGECAAKVIHLRRINTLPIPGLPATGTTTLTVLTDEEIYTFRLAFPDSGTPAYAVLAIQPATPSILSSPVLANRISGPSGAQLVAQGLSAAQRQNLIATDDPLWQRMQTFIERLSQGSPLSHAAQEAGVSDALVLRLAEMGRQNTERQGR
jgi:hypothetical protein